MTREDVIYAETETNRFPWGDPQIERKLTVVLFRRWQFGFSFQKPLKVNR